MARADENRDLRRCVQEMLALTTLSTQWNAAPFAAVAESLAEATLRCLPAEFVLVRINGVHGAAAHDVLRRRGNAPVNADALELVRQLLAGLGDARSTFACVRQTHPFAPGNVNLAVHAIGFEGEAGVLLAGSPCSTFPSEIDTLLLHAVANQAAIVLQHRRADLSLRESEERFARFMQHLPGLAWIKDAQGRYLYVNDAAEKAFRTPRIRLYGKTDDEVFPPETAAQFKANDRRALECGGAVRIIETLEQEDGVHHSLVSKFAIPGGGGAEVLVGGMAIDITERLNAEEALREADQRKDRFLATLAHELRNPLAPLRSGLQLLRLAVDDKAVLEQARSMMDRQLQHMVRLIDDLLDVSRITRGKLELRKQNIGLAAVIQSAIETCRPLLESAGHELTVTFPPEPIFLEADHARLGQVFSNLLNNAAKYTERGGHIALSAERQGDSAVVRVRDDGIGIPGPMLTRVFEMFTQVDDSLEKKHGGLGIGLTLARELVEMHGGSIHARSDGVGRGSEFVVVLPVAPRSESPAVADDESGAISSTPGLRIIVADDNQDAAESLGLLLRLTGHDVQTVQDGQEAVEAAAASLPDAIFLDIGMPRLNGYEAARQIREQSGDRGLVLIALTGWGQAEDRARALAAGFDHHLVKPVDAKTLHNLLLTVPRAKA